MNTLNNLIIPSCDEFLSEYVEDGVFSKVVNISCSNGIAILRQNAPNILLTDSRYTLIATKSLPDWKIFNMAEISLKNLLISLDIKEITVIQDYFSQTFIETLNKFHINFIHSNEIKNILKMAPIQQKQPFLHNEKHAGMNYQEKLKIIRSNIQLPYFISDPQSICWLLNIRGFDNSNTPIFNCFAIIDQDKVEVFSNCNVNLNLSGVEFKNISEIENIPHNIIYITKKETNAYIYSLLEKKSTLIDIDNRIKHYKSIKNEVQIEGFKKAHEIDSIAVEKLIDYVKTNQGNITELDVIHKSNEFRAENADFHSPSFDTIAGFNDNGAIIHYSATEKSSKIIKSDGLLLIDSGGQYQFGTTDVTRTIAIGNPENIFPNVKFHYTLVLKSLIMLSNTHFPKGITGGNLDAIARYNLWQNGLDFAHGTGHGVGHFLSVHEGNCGISRSKIANETRLEIGMVLSIEPGLYFDNQYGIRLENLVYVDKSDKFPDFLQFKTLTKVKFDNSLIDFEMLDAEEKEWLLRYNKQ